LRFIKDGKSGQLIDINALEYVTVIINYAVCYYYWVIERNCQAKEIPYPKVQPQSSGQKRDAKDP